MTVRDPTQPPHSPIRAWLAWFWQRHNIDFGFALTLLVSVLLFLISRLFKDSQWGKLAFLGIWTLYALISFIFYGWRKRS